MRSGAPVPALRDAQPDGTGLGLWISCGLVERYGSDTRAGNRSGGGPVFTVVLNAVVGA